MRMQPSSLTRVCAHSGAWRFHSGCGLADRCLYVHAHAGSPHTHTHDADARKADSRHRRHCALGTSSQQHRRCVVAWRWVCAADWIWWHTRVPLRFADCTLSLSLILRRCWSGRIDITLLLLRQIPAATQWFNSCGINRGLIHDEVRLRLPEHKTVQSDSFAWTVCWMERNCSTAPM